MAYSKTKFKEVLGYKRMMSRKQTSHERMFGELLRSAYTEVYGACHKGDVKVQKIFMGDGFAYIADFYIPKLDLVFEIDGKDHSRKVEYDAIRTSFIASRGMLVKRYTNQEVLHLTGESLEGVLKARRSEIADRIRIRGVVKAGYVSKKEDSCSLVSDYLASGGKVERLAMVNVRTHKVYRHGCWFLGE